MGLFDFGKKKGNLSITERGKSIAETENKSVPVLRVKIIEAIESGDGDNISSIASSLNIPDDVVGNIIKRMEKEGLVSES
jgi:DNA-binding MarR family transcriptional regulator